MLCFLIILLLIDNASWRTTYFPSLQHQPHMLHNNTACTNLQPYKKLRMLHNKTNTNLSMHAPHMILVLFKAPDSSSLKGDFPCHCVVVMPWVSVKRLGTVLIEAGAKSIKLN